MTPNCVKICIVCDDPLYTSLLRSFLHRECCFFVYTSNFNSIPDDKDVYILVTDKLSDLDKFGSINALKIIISDNLTDNMLHMCLRNGVTVFYDHSLDLEWLYDIGLHLCIYERGNVCIDIPSIIKVVTKSKKIIRKYGKIQI